MRKFLPWTEIVVFVILNVVYFGVGGLLLSNPINWGGGVIMVGGGIGLLLLGLSIFGVCKKLWAVPDYITEQYVGVWGVDGRPCEEAMSRALKTFMRHIGEYPFINFAPDTVSAALSGVSVHWGDAYTNALSRLGWRIRDADGMQNGRYVWVRWGGYISGSALVHALGHRLREYAKMPLDREHKDSKFWNYIDLINTEISRQFWDRG